ncbi:hypothetical protein [Chitinophaga sp. CF418]|uniref:hypothetical protein n=1 Tax=Chitinophaga sp. CF418 TaxID=1855287 RepID=UPI00091897FF|nr:hypothetical protein [Chitinophaga sp. CF418]SHM23686.1 hypothetical protein SAMN05216311_101924 [Chitinophaga sp. CF418]
MKKGRIILALIALLAIAGGGLAFKAMRFTNEQAFTTTTIIYVTINGVTYYTTGNLCTTINQWITDVGSPAVVWHLVGVPTTTRTLKQWPSGPLTTTLPFWLCVTTSTKTTSDM